LKERIAHGAAARPLKNPVVLTWNCIGHSPPMTHA
jgi:hypothetical protein